MGISFLVLFLLFSKSQGLADNMHPEEEDENYNVVSLYVQPGITERMAEELAHKITASKSLPSPPLGSITLPLERLKSGGIH